MLVTVDVVSPTVPVMALQLAGLGWAGDEPEYRMRFLGGRGRELYLPWRSRGDRELGLVAAADRRDGWGLPTRFAVLAVWPDDRAPSPLRLPGGRAREAWRGLFQPVNTHGSVRGRNPLASAPGAPSTGAGAILTRGSGGGHIAEFLRQTGRIVEHLHRTEGLLTAFNMLGMGRQGPALCTLSCWRDLGDAVRFAYRGPAEHREAIRRVKTGYYGRETFFARLALLESRGTIAGRNPFAGVTLSDSSPVMSDPFPIA